MFGERGPEGRRSRGPCLCHLNQYQESWESICAKASTRPERLVRMRLRNCRCLHNHTKHILLRMSGDKSRHPRSRNSLAIVGRCSVTQPSSALERIRVRHWSRTRMSRFEKRSTQASPAICMDTHRCMVSQTHALAELAASSWYSTLPVVLVFGLRGRCRRCCRGSAARSA